MDVRRLLGYGARESRRIRVSEKENSPIDDKERIGIPVQIRDCWLNEPPSMVLWSWSDRYREPDIRFPAIPGAGPIRGMARQYRLR